MTEQIQSAPPVCKKCGCEKTWYPNRKKPIWACSSCRKAYGRNYYQNNKDKHSAFMRQWYLKNKDSHKENGQRWYQENKDKHLANCAAWELANKQRRSEWRREWKLANSELEAAKHRRYAQNHPEKIRVKCQTRRAKKAVAIVHSRPVTVAIEAERKALFDGCCYCGAQKKLTLDHVVALDAGGLHVEENLLGACGACNSSKRNRPVEQWFRAQEFFTEERWQQIQDACA